MPEIDLRFFLDDEEPAVPVPVPVPVDDVPLAAKLSHTASIALDNLDEVLALPLPNPSDPAFGNTARAKTSAANIALNAQLRVDETSLRARQTDMMPRLLEILAREERKLDLMDRQRNPKQEK